MDYGNTLAGIGLLLMVVELILPLRLIGAAGAALFTGAVVGLLFPDDYWLAFSLGFFICALVSGWVLSYLYQLAGDFSNLATAASNLIGKYGVVVEAIDPHSKKGKVEIDGDVWTARAHLAISEGSSVALDSIDGCCATVHEESN